MRLLLAALLFSAAPQDPAAEDLVRRLASPDFEEQGKAAKALEAMGPVALPALEKALKSDQVEVRTWAERIKARLEESGRRLRELITRLGSADDEEKEAAERELRAIGRPAAPYLADARESENKNLRLRAAKLLKEIGGSEPGVSRLEGKRNRVARGGGGGETEDSVLAALKWLSRHQSADGSWKVAGYTDECNKIPKYQGGKCAPNPGADDFDEGVTGLALLALVGAGYSPLSKDTYDGICFGDVVQKGLEWVMAHQDKEGCIGRRNVQKYVYNHAIAAAALIEAYGLAGSPLLKAPAQKAADFLVAAQNPGKGWRYSPKCGDNDTSVTSWAVLALKSAEVAGLAVPKSAFDGARAWFDEATDDAQRVGYTHKGTGKVFIPGVNENFDHHEALTAMAVVGRIFMDRNQGDRRLSGGCDLLLRDKPKWDGNRIDFYYWHHASMALYQFDGPSGAKWKAWNEDLKDALLGHQNAGATGCKSGSWEPVDRWSGEGGRVYATALNALTLEVYYRYPPAFGR